MILRNWEICSIPKYVGNIGEAARAENSLEIWKPPMQICLSSTLMERQKGIRDRQVLGEPSVILRAMWWGYTRDILAKTPTM